MTTIFSFVVDVLAQLLVIIYPPVLVFWLIIHSNIDRWRGLGNRSYWIAALAWPMISGPLLYYRELLFEIRWPAPWWLKTIGGVAFLFGVWLAVLSSRVISPKTLVGIPELNPQDNGQPLMHTGIYGKTRNPIYLAHSLFIFAAAAMTGFGANWGLLALDVLLLPLMIRAEERELMRRYGEEYREYMRRVPRLFPF